MISSEDRGKPGLFSRLARRLRAEPTHDVPVEFEEAATDADGVVELVLTRFPAQLADPDRDEMAWLDMAARRLEFLEDRPARAYEAAHALYPDHDGVVIGLATAYAMAGEREADAREVYEDALRRQPDLPWALWGIAAIHEAAGRSKQAQSQYERLERRLELATAEGSREEIPECGRLDRLVTLALARLFARQERLGARAEALYSRALNFDPDCREARIALALRYAQKRRTDARATDVMRQAIDWRPNDPRLVLGLARAEFQRGHREEALKRLREGAHRFPEDQALKSLTVEVALAEGNIEADDWEQAERLLEAGELENPEQTVLALADAFIQAGRYDDRAIGLYEKAIEIAEDPTPHRLALRRALRRQRRWDRLREVCEELRRSGGADDETWVDLAEALAREGLEGPDSARVYRRALQAGWKNPDALARAAREIVRSGEATEEALRILQEAVVLDPRNLDFRQALVAAALATDRIDTAVREGLRLARHAEGDDAAVEQAAEALARAEEPPGDMEILSVGQGVASRLARRAVDLAPDSARLLERAARVLAEENQRDPHSLEICAQALDAGRFDYEVAHFLTAAWREQGKSALYLDLLWRAWRSPAPESPTPTPYGENARSQEEHREEMVAELVAELVASGASDDRAREVFLDYLSSNVGEPELTLHVARSYREDAELRKVLPRVFLAAAEQAPEDPELGLTAARLALDANDPIGAQTYLRPALAPETVTDEALDILAAALNTRNELAAGILDRLENLYLKQPERPAVVIALAMAYLSGERSDAIALMVYEQARALRPHDLRLLVMIADAYRGLDANEEAVEAYKSLLERAPDDPDTVRELARAYTQMPTGSRDALEVVERALDNLPDDPEVNLAYATMLYGDGDREEALGRARKTLHHSPRARSRVIETLEAMARLAPEHAPTRLFLADLLVQDRRPDDALDAIRELYGSPQAPVGDLIEMLERIRHESSDPEEIAIEEAILFKSVGMFEECLEKLRPVAKARPKDVNVQQEYQEALEMMTRTSLRPPLRLELARHYLSINQPSEAIPLLHALYEEDRKNEEVVLWLGIAFMRVGRLELALRQFDRLPVTETLKPALFELGNDFARLRRFDEAIETIERIREVDPGNNDIVQLIEWWRQQAQHAGGDADRGMDDFGERARRRYELLELLGRGANGEVFKAFDHELDEIVALKILPEKLLYKPEALARFRFEAKAARRLGHRNVVRIFDIGEEEGQKYISMEFVDGPTLQRKIAEAGRLPVEETCRYAWQTAAALHYAHSEDVIHRDVKPANIMINSKGVLKLADFGVAALKSKSDTSTTQARLFAGTPSYMSPEQILGNELDGRCDLYSLGVVLYEMLAGAPPFAQGDVAYLHVHATPAPPETEFGDLAAIAMKCLEKKPDDRYRNGADLMNALREAAARLGVALGETE